jgi:hypothetical protein
MSTIRLIPLDHSEVEPLVISPRLRSQLVYFHAPAGGAGVPELGPGEMYFREDEVDQWYDDGVILLVSPLDTDNKTEVELSEEQETMLGWLKSHGIRRVRLEE